MIPKDLRQMIYSYLSLEEVYKIPSVNINTYCKYTHIENSGSIYQASGKGHLEVVTDYMDLSSRNDHL
jgi:hypothetical protein